MEEALRLLRRFEQDLELKEYTGVLKSLYSNLKTEGKNEQLLFQNASQKSVIVISKSLLAYCWIYVI